LSIIILILLVLTLTSGSFSLSLGLQIRQQKSWSDRLLIALIFGAVQAMMLFLGMWLGQRFMHLFKAHYQIVVFAIFGLIAFRMIQEALKIRKENRLFAFESYSKLLIVAIAAGINSLIAGLAISAFQPPGAALPLAFLLAAAGWALLGLTLSINRLNILTASFSQLISAFIMFVISFLYLFNFQWF